MIKLFAAFIIAILFTGCAATYTLGAKKYENEQSFQAAIESERLEAIQQVKPLPSALTTKKLIAALPSESAIYEENSKRHTLITGRPLFGIAIEQNKNLSKAAYKLNRVFFEGLEKKRVYTTVEILDMPSMSVSIEPSIEYDVIYFTEPSVGSGQYFYASAKHGKQVFAFDRSGDGVTAKVNAFIDAAQAQAIRD